LAIWQPDIVNRFVNADLSLSLEPEGLAACFECEKGTVAEFLEKLGREPVEVQIAELQKVLLGTIRDRSIVGTYSKFHENAIYKLGYGNKQSTDLAHM
jgi:RNA-dependent RNA polymerase